MQATSATWRALAAAGTARLETVAVIDGTEYVAISAPAINRALTQDGLSVGNAVSASCQFSVLTDDSIPRAAKVVIRMRLSDGEKVSEWLPAGTFFVSHREKDAVTGLTALECYDAMLKANAAYSREGAWPRSMAEVAAEIAEALGVGLDPRTRLQKGDDFMVSLPEAGMTMREVLCGIASAQGGNWVVTQQNKLRLLTLGSTEDEAEALAVLGGVSAGAEQTITGLRVTGIGEERLIGTDGGLVLEIASPYATDGGLEWLSGRLIGSTYQPYALRAAIYDPAVELGDRVRSKDDVMSALYCENAMLGLAFRGDISAPEPGELADEYPYIGASDRLKQLYAQVQTLEATKADEADVAAAEDRANAAAQAYAAAAEESAKTAAQAYADNAEESAKTAARSYADAAKASANAVTRALDAALTQQEVFNRLTNDGETQGLYLKDGKLYINGSYIDAGTLDADLIRAGTIADESGENYWILDGDNSEFVTRKGVIGDFILEDGALQYGSLEVGGQGSYIGKAGVIYNVTLNTGSTSKVQIFAQGLDFYWNGALKTRLFQGAGGINLRCYDDSGAQTTPFQAYNADGIQGVYLRYDTRCTERLYVSKATTMYGGGTVIGDFSVSGTKSRRVSTSQYSDRLLYCYETPSPLFGDVGDGVIGEDGKCYVWLDAVFAGTISTSRYQVFLQRYGAGECHIAERRPACFVVAGTPGLAFGWELKAKQRDFDQRRLDGAEPPYTPTGTDYGALASQHITDLQKGRIEAA
ncbi:MAG: hypothetical protein IJ769_02410 [Clostridia bacterium]|nr:hypothetical protein [Clostridia bacterium]